MCIHVKDFFELLPKGKSAGIVKSYKPENPEHFRVDVTFWVAWEKEKPGYQYYVYVCSPSAFFTDLVPESEVCSGRHYIVMQKYDESQLKDFIESYVKSLDGIPYSQQLEKLVWFAQWECEDFHFDDEGPILTHEVINHSDRFKL